VKTTERIVAQNKIMQANDKNVWAPMSSEEGAMCLPCAGNACMVKPVWIGEQVPLATRLFDAGAHPVILKTAHPPTFSFPDCDWPKFTAWL